jgi:pimeloyl-ACP methyl ester carboxylesterase
VSAALPARIDVVSLSMGSAVALRLALTCPERVRRLVLVTPAGGADARRFGATDWRPAFRARRPDAPPWFVDDDASDLSDDLGGVTARTLLVASEHDSIAPVAFANHLRTRLPFATLEVVPAATHDLEDEFPDLAASLIEAHFRRTDDA